jgi:O-antigen/teichoic acid export membrane protein
VRSAREPATSARVLVSTTELSDSGPALRSSPAADSDKGVSSSIWRRIRRDVLLLGAGNIGTVIAQLVFRSILIAALVPAAYGRLSLILSIYSTVWIIGASGVPSSVARYIALIAPADDAGIVRSAVRAAALPTIIATTIVAAISGVLLNSLLACVFALCGLSSLVYSLLTMGILRGRGRIGASASILPIAAVAEAGPLAVMWLSGLGVTMQSAFGLFCLGNVIGLCAGVFFTLRTAPRRTSSTALPREDVPSARELLGFSMWLGAATVGVAMLPLVIRLAAALDSYTVVAMIDVAVVLLSIPQRVGAVILMAVVPHAVRAIGRGGVKLTISRRENMIMIAPFVLVAGIVAFTPILSWLFDALGRPVYAKGAEYLALALLAGPARILYGVVEGVLIAHGEGRFLAVMALSITAVASGMIFAATALGSPMVAFAVFVAALWVIYLAGLMRISRLPPVRDLSIARGRSPQIT